MTMLGAAHHRAMTEDELVGAVLDLLGWYGWRVTHHRRSDRAITQGDPGEPDIRAVRDGRALWIECKSARGRLSPEQAAWLTAYAQVPGCICRVMRPYDLTDLKQELTRTAGKLDPYQHPLTDELEGLDAW